MECSNIGGELGGRTAFFAIDEDRGWLIGGIFMLGLSLNGFAVGLKNRLGSLTGREGDLTISVNSQTSRGDWSPVPPVRRVGAYQLGKLVGTPRVREQVAPVSATGAVPPSTTWYGLRNILKIMYSHNKF